MVSDGSSVSGCLSCVKSFAHNAMGASVSRQEARQTSTCFLDDTFVFLAKESRHNYFLPLEGWIVQI